MRRHRDVGLCALADGDRRHDAVAAAAGGAAVGERVRRRGALGNGAGALLARAEARGPIATDFVITRAGTDEASGAGIARLDVPDDVAVNAWDAVY